MNIADLVDAVRQVIELLDDYSGSHVGGREMLLDPILYGYLRGRFRHMSRQHPIPIAGTNRRIDFRHGGSNPTVIEFAVRPPHGGGTLYGGQNRSELQKLTRVSNTSARTRVMLLVDLSPVPLDRDNLKRTYDDQGSGPGNFKRHSVRVLYVHADTDFHFLWRP
jgi:hypothetical protein